MTSVAVVSDPLVPSLVLILPGHASCRVERHRQVASLTQDRSFSMTSWRSKISQMLGNCFLIVTSENWLSVCRQEII